MKTIWNVLAVMCFVNILAMLALGGWLANSGRINQARVDQVRSIFEQSVQAEQLEAEQLEQQTLIENDGVEVMIPDRPPVTAEDQLTMRVLQNASDRQRIQRLEREVNDLRAALQRERELVDHERTQLESDQAKFDLMRMEIAQTEGAEQFRKALTTIESVPAKAAMGMLLSLIETGNRDEAVGYLNAMQDRSRTKVIAELVKDTQTELAAQLLEELRIRGVGDAPSEAQSE